MSPTPHRRRPRRARAYAAVVAPALAAAACLSLVSSAPTAEAAPEAQAAPEARAALAAGAAPTGLARATLRAGDGWAAEGAGTKGGSAADPAHLFTVTTRAQLAAALRAGPAGAPRVIQVKGVIDANTDDAGRPLRCDDYAAGTGYSTAAYLKAYDPATWGRSKRPSGAQEKARAAAQAEQAARVVLDVPSRTTIVGLPGTGATIRGGSLQVRGADDVIIRNLTFADTRDCFPQWDPTDGEDGNWNSAYDAVSLRGATHVWADHNTFTDSPGLDRANPRHYGREYQVHDGALDITNASDLVTVSYNRFSDHDKTMLIGSSDKDTKLRVTLHHNVFEGVTQRAPLVRVGRTHLYNNLFLTAPRNGYTHQYSVNTRAGAQVVAEANHWVLSKDRKVAQILSGDGTGAFAGSGNLVNGAETDLVGAHNAAHPKKRIKPTADWRPALTTGREPSAAGLPATLPRTAGAGLLTSAGTLP
ncbi:pectate lyase family protein [Streptomyces sp. URMC 123]|uniref:pectate lyase family protein n=1 Tax=Streptomyces sp. URMC 123 TaxID=3423403 RepID=UPI003F1DC43B